MEKFRKEITERHNYYRKEHNVGELERDSELEKIAQNAAEYMSEIDSIYTMNLFLSIILLKI